jgi:hypothetical protein
MALSTTDADIIVARLSEQLVAIHEDLHEVKDLAKATNGRVRDLESWRARIDGQMAFVGVVGVAVVGAVVKLLVGG